GGVGGDERVAGAAREDHDAALIQMAHSPTAEVWLRHAFHSNRPKKPGFAVDALPCLLGGPAVHDGRERSPAGGRGVPYDVTAGRELAAAEDVAAADHDGELHATLDDALCGPGNVERFVDVDAALAGVSERLTAQLEDHAAVTRFQICGLVHRPAP